MASTLFTDGVTLSAAAWFNDVDSLTYGRLSAVAGTNTVTATGPTSLTAYSVGQRFTFTPAVTNTGATTLNISSLGAGAVQLGGAALIGGELSSTFPVLVEVSAVTPVFQILNLPTATGTAATTFTFDGGGGTTASKTLTYQKVGKWMTLNVPAVTGTSGTGSTLLTADTALVAALRPATQQWAPVMQIINNNASVATPGALQLGTNGVLIIVRDAALTAFTNSSTCGTGQAQSVTYFLG